MLAKAETGWRSEGLDWLAKRDSVEPEEFPRMTRRPPSGTVSQADDRPNIVTRDSEGRHPSAQSLRGLDWLNFLLADVQSGVGPFLAI